MHIRYGFDLGLDLAQPTTILTMVDVHSDCRHAVVGELEFELSPAIPAARFIDHDGNVVRRLSAQPGPLSLRLEGVFHTHGRKDAVDRTADAWAVSELPPDALPFLRPSRYCETELLSDLAWKNFGAIAGGWAKVQAICDFVHQRLTFGYPHARPTRTASEALAEGVGVCRDFTHLAIAFCRCLNIPARYCNGYLGDIGVPPDPRRWISTPGSKSFLAVAGLPSTPAQSAADRPDLDLAGSRRRGYSDAHDIRLARAHALQDHHRRGRGRRRACGLNAGSLQRG